MAKTIGSGEEIIQLIKQGHSVQEVKNRVASNPNEWYRLSSEAYLIALERSRKEREVLMNKKHVSATSNKEILEIIELNKLLSDYALLLPTMSTTAEFKNIQSIATQLPASEAAILKIIANITMQPKLRILQKKGRFEKFNHFRTFSKMIDAATLSYYRTNFISCYLTLLPVIEGIIIRWMGYAASGIKPKFGEIRCFFRNSAQRQPNPENILFHDVYIKACDKILNNHFYKQTTSIGISYANFNRHVASHLLNDDQFATKDNCIRLFILLDAMTEIFLYESRDMDPRFSLGTDDIATEVEGLAQVLLDNMNTTPEHLILGTNISDIVN